MAIKRRVGKVLSATNLKTIIVGVSWLQNDPVYLKARRRTSKFSVHDENNDASLDDQVLIEETKPKSKTKNWRLVEILQKSQSGMEDSSDQNLK
ncbi:30S ribosomal protein S17 [Dehalococcoidia bacterium]|nr:30S ribosomal protein S17 [Dehalococcoidia bacterium]